MLKFDLTFAQRRQLIKNRLPLAIGFFALAFLMCVEGNGLLAIPCAASAYLAGWLAWKPLTRRLRGMPHYVFGTLPYRAIHRGKATFAHLRRRVVASRAAMTTLGALLTLGCPAVLACFVATGRWGWVFVTGRA